jgi:hypothetical protein
VFFANSPSSFHVVGSAGSDSSWVALSSSKPGYLTYGPYTSSFRNGVYKANFKLRVDNVDADENDIGRLEVYDSASQRVLAQRTFHRREFTTPMAYQDFELTFTSSNTSILEFRVYYIGNSYLEHAQTSITPISMDVPSDLVVDANSYSFTHDIGNASDHAWETRVTDGPGYMTRGPRSRLLPIDIGTATFTLAVDNNSADNLSVLRLEVVDVATNQVLATRLVKRQDFRSPMTPQEFDLTYELRVPGEIDFRVYSYATSYIKHFQTVVKSDRVGFEALWNGTAHFEPRTRSMLGSTSSVVALDGVEYAFVRQYFPKHPGCDGDVTLKTGVSMSSDHGVTWTDPVTILDAPSGNGPDACMVTDGSAFYDAETDVWHMLYQCLGKSGSGGWQLCHYTKQGSSPMGAYTPDSANPVVRGGQLWSKICGGYGKACPANMVDEGTVQIIRKTNGYYYVTFHGANSLSGGRTGGARGVARTRDFKTWETSGADLPGNAMMSPADCNVWDANWSPGGCIGEGDASLIRSGGYNYMLVEATDKSLICTPGQQWVFGLMRSRGLNPSGYWENYVANPFVMDPVDTPWGCRLQYMNFTRDRGDVFLSFGYASAAGTFPNRIYQLVKGPGPSRVIPQ